LVDALKIIGFIALLIVLAIVAGFTHKFDKEAKKGGLLSANRNFFLKGGLLKVLIVFMVGFVIWVCLYYLAKF
jgi:hypothetical protein